MRYLIVVDYQNDFVTGALANERAQEMYPRMRECISNFNGQVIFTKDTHFSNYLETQEGKNLPIPHCQTPEGKAIYNHLDDETMERPFYICKNTFGATQFNWFLEDEPEEIIIVGVATNICVISNALMLKALYPETPMKCYANLCAGTSQEAHDAALIIMKSCQINVEDY